MEEEAPARISNKEPVLARLSWEKRTHRGLLRFWPDGRLAKALVGFPVLLLML